jgi:hypothetical protein
MAWLSSFGNMMEMHSHILKRLKQKKGCSLHDLPGQHDTFDLHSDSWYFVDAPKWVPNVEPLRQLISWGLVEAYERSELVPANKLRRLSDSSLESLTFYISPLAATIEQRLGISLTATPIFGAPVQRGSLPQVFVLMPFAPKHRPIYTDHISVVCKNLGLSVGRADDFFSTGSIMADVWSAINFATVLIADCTDRNPNVFYEIGVAHTVGKDTILISQSLDDIPFDLRHLRTIIFEYTPPGMIQFEKTLSSTLWPFSKVRS